MKSEKVLMRLLLAGEFTVLILMIFLGLLKQMKGSENLTDYSDSMQNNQSEMPSTNTEENDITNIPGEEQPGENAGDEGTNGPGGESPADTEGGDSTSVPGKEPTKGNDGTEDTDVPGEKPPVFSDEVVALLDTMTTEQKVAQLFIVSPEDFTNSSRVIIAGDRTRSALEKYPIGGFLYVKAHYRNETQIMDLIRGAQTLSYESSGRYLFAGMLYEMDSDAFIMAALNGQEEALIRLLVSDGTEDEHEWSVLVPISLVQNLQQISAEYNEDTLLCYQMGTDIKEAVTAIQNGADMLCVTENFTEVYEEVLAAVYAQSILEDTLNQAVGRILTEKAENER